MAISIILDSIIIKYHSSCHKNNKHPCHSFWCKYCSRHYGPRRCFNKFELLTFSDANRRRLNKSIKFTPKENVGFGSFPVQQCTCTWGFKNLLLFQSWAGLLAFLPTPKVVFSAKIDTCLRNSFLANNFKTLPLSWKQNERPHLLLEKRFNCGNLHSSQQLNLSPILKTAVAICC